MKQLSKNSSFIILLAIFLVVFAFGSLFLGRYYVEPGQVIHLLWSGLTGAPLDSVDKTVVLDIRLPRLLIVILVGAGLSISGTAFQGCFHNPLVSPDVLGVSAGAGFGAALGILLTNGVNGITAAMAFFFGILSVVLSLLLSRIKSESSILALVLSGIIVSAVFNALISLVKFVADTDSQLPAITFWLMGSFSNTTYNELGKIVIPILAGITVLIAMRWRINVLTLGDEEATTMGVNPRKMRFIIIAAATIITAASVMVAGIIGWVGLIIPNLCRMIVGSDHKYLMPASCLCGAVFLLIVDFIARVLTPSEIPIGILTAIIGAPFFALVYKKTEGC
ncbi:FecCD family ABC transporter permease [Acetobacterium woodii]|uniref:ABC transport system permease protein n=1 Tax=Acetobacterium woodii (strain ATCC 29683 / DSM 1030 / JCM 2381 / KCTC 1655 / WB1) TaxID=931626 RepID=H6LEB4_ACEWD|nr:iron ABC transporter permease [Acetobacterium woodii]AFA46828.1 ABC transport system permease protein [Acetobacterium woodii DSM 1030]